VICSPFEGRFHIIDLSFSTWTGRVMKAQKTATKTQIYVNREAQQRQLRPILNFRDPGEMKG